jgi:hypothetical protein
MLQILHSSLLPSTECGYNVVHPLKVNRRFGGTRRLHLQVRRINQARKQCKLGRKLLAGSVCCLLQADLFFVDTESGDIFLRNIGWFSTGSIREIFTTAVRTWASATTCVTLTQYWRDPQRSVTQERFADPPARGAASLQLYCASNRSPVCTIFSLPVRISSRIAVLVGALEVLGPPRPGGGGGTRPKRPPTL